MNRSSEGRGFRREKIAAATIAVLLFSSVCAGATECVTRLSKGTHLEIVRRPQPDMAYTGGRLTSIPPPNSTTGPESLWQIDLRSVDLTGIDVKDRLKDLLLADFDSRTKWPNLASVPSYNPAKIMELGKNPGLGLTALHKRGIIGKGIGIAIIDQTLLTSHCEYRDALRLYEEVHCPLRPAEMHGTAVASIAVGKTVGVAPGADLYFIANAQEVRANGGTCEDWIFMAEAIDRIVEINRSLQKDNRIRVLAVSVSWRPSEKNYEAVVKAVERAKADGIFVVSPQMFVLYPDFKPFINGLGREPLADPDDPASYGPGIFWGAQFLENPERLAELRSATGNKPHLLVPMDSRSFAGFTGNHDYEFCRAGGWGWSVPYVAGLYALACQVCPDVTPDRFWAAALETGHPLVVDSEGGKCDLGRIANPDALLDLLGRNGRR